MAPCTRSVDSDMMSLAAVRHSQWSRHSRCAISL